MTTPASAFAFQGLILPLATLHPIRQAKPRDGALIKYRAIVASIREIGIIEPLIVFPNAETTGSYFLLDGHLRHKALQELGRTEALCLIARDNDVLTYNDKVNRLSAIQEHAMIRRAMEQGVTPEAIAKALDVDMNQVMGKVNLLDGLDSRAVNLLQDRLISVTALGQFRRVTPDRQVEMAQLMVASENYSDAYARALLVGTPAEQWVGKKARVTRGLSPEDAARLQGEMTNLARELRTHQEQFGLNSLRLNAAQRYVKRLLANAKVKRFLANHYTELLEEFEEIAALEAI